MSSNRTSDNSLDIELIKQIKKGDSNALNKLLDLYIPQLTAFFKYIHVPVDSIEDLVQETFVKVINKIDSFDETKRFSTWLMTIGRNIYIDQYRKKTKGDEILSAEKEENQPYSDPENEVIGKMSVEELLKSLNDKERFLIEMRIFRQMPFAEISEITKETETSLRSRFFRILNRLKTML